MRISFIANAPDSEVADALRGPIDRLRAAGHEVHPRLTFESGDARRMAKAGCRAGSELVIAAGGDGTLNEVVNGIHDFLSAADADGSVPRLGIVPLGTANDFAAALEIPMEVETAVEVASGGVPTPIDVGVVDDRCFLNVSTGGFGAEATEETAAEVKRTLGPLAYLVTGVAKFVTLEVSRARFTSGAKTIYDGSFLLFAVGNGRRTGGGNWLTPRAELRDGMLDLCVVKEMSRVEFLRLLPELRTGRHLAHPGVIYRQVPEVTVESHEEISVNADGEPLSGRTFRYRISSHQIPVMLARRPGAT